MDALYWIVPLELTSTAAMIACLQVVSDQELLVFFMQENIPLSSPATALIHLVRTMSSSSLLETRIALQHVMDLSADLTLLAEAAACSTTLALTNVLTAVKLVTWGDAPTAILTMCLIVEAEINVDSTSVDTRVETMKGLVLTSELVIYKLVNARL